MCQELLPFKQPGCASSEPTRQCCSDERGGQNKNLLIKHSGCETRLQMHGEDDCMKHLCGLVSGMGWGFFPQFQVEVWGFPVPDPQRWKWAALGRLHPQPQPGLPSNALAPNSSTIIHFGREQCQRSPFGQWLRKKGRPKDIPGQEKQSEIPPPARGSRNELAGLEVPVTPVTELGKSQEHLFREQGVHLVRRTALASIYVL